MATTPTAPVPTPSPGVSNFFKYFNALAPVVAATIQADQADISAGDHLAAVTDTMTGVAYGFGQINPIWGVEAQAALSVATPFIGLLVSLFHKKPAA